jgi:hypothetical protein
MLSIYKNIFIKQMVIEMLLNSDIEFIFCSSDFTLSKKIKCNYVLYWIINK